MIFDHEWRLVLAMVNAVSAGWNDPDHGIWEARQRPRHHIHSKVMCWWAVARALASLAGRRIGCNVPRNGIG
jgi:trehalose 6-phosphate phosphatase